MTKLRTHTDDLILGPVISLGLALAQVTCACDPITSFQRTPFVEKSNEDAPRRIVDMNRIQSGVYRPTSPRCLYVRLGHTVEFRNFLPSVPANVTGISGPDALYSPNLVRPYQYVPPNDPQNELCEVFEGERCTARPEWSYWRHRFDTPGTYDWLDTNQGQPGRRVVDAYYGTVTFVGVDPSTPISTVCVTAEDGAGCDGICCETDTDCTGNTRCLKPPTDAVGRCLTPSG